MRTRLFWRIACVDAICIGLQAGLMYITSLGVAGITTATVLSFLVLLAGLLVVTVVFPLVGRPWLWAVHVHVMTFLYCTVAYVGEPFNVSKRNADHGRCVKDNFYMIQFMPWEIVYCWMAASCVALEKWELLAGASRRGGSGGGDDDDGGGDDDGDGGAGSGSGSGSSGGGGNHDHHDEQQNRRMNRDDHDHDDHDHDRVDAADGVSEQGVRASTALTDGGGGSRGTRAGRSGRSDHGDRGSAAAAGVVATLGAPHSCASLKRRCRWVRPLLLLFLLPWLIGIHLNYFGKVGVLPNMKLTVRDIGSWDAGTWAAFAFGFLVVITGLGNAVYHTRREGTLGLYVAGYAAVVATNLVARQVARPLYAMHLHHWYLAATLLPLTRFPGRVTMVYHGLGAGFMMQGIATYGPSPFVKWVNATSASD